MKIPRFLRLFGVSAFMALGTLLWSYYSVQVYRLEILESPLRFAEGLLHGRSERSSLKMGDGVSLEERDRLVGQLKEVAKGKPFNLDIQIIPTTNSTDALEKVARGELDAAFVHGGMESTKDIEQLAALVTIPLHMLVSDRQPDDNLKNFKDDVMWMDSEGSGTHDLASKVLRFADKDSFARIKHDPITFEQLRKLKPGTHPRVIFLTSALPSTFMEELVRDHGYRLHELPFGQALGLRHYGIQPAEIPESAYGLDGRNTRPSARTVGSRILLVVSKQNPMSKRSDQQKKQWALSKLLESIYEGDFARRANLPELNEAEMDRSPEYPLSEATRAFRNRNQSIFTGENVQAVEAVLNLAFFGVVLLILPFRLLIRFFRSKRFESLLRKIIRLDEEIEQFLKIARGSLESMPGHPALLANLDELSAKVNRDFATGRLPKQDQFDRLSAYIASLRARLSPKS